ncbi:MULTISPECIES: hypothetical protein [unclassified Enterococcus]|jgi:hypothetical protein|uniref:hypothetical protein n=1 Tax=unclassified Enterococcus TaxID=2608891 RepID=UPI003D2E3203
MRPNLGYYVQSIDNIVKETEAIGEEMNPSYENIRKAINEEKVSELSTKMLAETHDLFEKGTAKYRDMLKKISTLRPPAKVMGIHKKFERSYMEYVAGCEEMIQSIDLEKGVQVDLFDQAEEKQDQATDAISVSIQKMTKMMLGK